MNTHSHLEESLQRDLEVIRAKIAEMSGLDQRALEASMEALANRNRLLAYSIILRDQYIDEMETELDRLCLEFLVRHQPVGGHLRFIFATIHINRELERIGDYAESIARQVLAITALECQPPTGKFLELGKLAVHMLHDAVHSFLHADAALASRTMAIEERANSMRNVINAEFTGLAQANRIPAAALTPLVTVARRLERVTDQAKNLCEEVLYMCSGEFSKHKGAEGFHILFLDSNNGCASQMAEALANSMSLPHFTFQSAGITPQPLDPRLATFMNGKGIDISTQASKSLEQVRGWESSHLIIALSAEARESLPVHSGKSILFTWPCHDPCQAEGGSVDVSRSMEELYRFLQGHIKELVDAISQEPHSLEKL